MSRQLVVSPSPHLRSANTTANIMFDVILALLPALFVSVIYFGWRALLVTAVCAAACVAFEYLIRRIMKRDNTVSDLSAIVTGMLLAFNLPPSIPLWVAVLGCFFAIVIVKQLFGGIGQNFANPAVSARIMLFISFPVYMTTWLRPFAYRYSGEVDTVAGATPLLGINEAGTLDLFLGNVPGCIGEVSALALLIGGIYLVIRRVIHPLVPLAFLGTVFLFTWAAGDHPLNHLLAGGLMLGAIFMATDYATTPSTLKGKLIFAVGCGLVASLIRLFGSYPEGVSFSILLMNLLTPLIDRVTMTRPFGTKGGNAHG